jgi:hypothetical protein
MKQWGQVMLAGTGGKYRAGNFGRYFAHGASFLRYLE